jgi:hypothetical protein
MGETDIRPGGQPFMDENTLTIIVLVLVVIMILVVPPLRIRRAANSMINNLRKMNAVDEKSARTPEELGVRLTSFVPSTNLFGGGDPNQAAMSALREANVIMMTSDGRLYLSEANLGRSKWSQQKG